jgi:2-oxoglutarate dehydrogenase E1 component
MMKQFLANSYLFGGNAPFIEELYEQYLVNPGAVPEGWREYFDQMQLMPGAQGNGDKDVAHAPVVESFVQRAKAGQLGGSRAPVEFATHERLQVAALLLVTSYRISGSRRARRRLSSSPPTTISPRPISTSR